MPKKLVLEKSATEIKVEKAEDSCDFCEDRKLIIETREGYCICLDCAQQVVSLLTSNEK